MFKIFKLRGRILRILDVAQTWLVPPNIVSSVSRFEPTLNWNRFLTIQLNDLNSLNSTLGNFQYWVTSFFNPHR